MPDSEIAAGILKKEEELGLSGKDIVRLAGPDCFSKKPDYKGGGQGPSTSEVFAGFGIALSPGDADKKKKIRQFYERLRVPQDGTAPMLQVYDCCIHTIRTIPDLVTKENDPEVLEDRGAEDHIYDMLCHVCNARPINLSETVEAKTKEQMLIEIWEHAADRDDVDAVAGYYGPDRSALEQIFGQQQSGEDIWEEGINW